MELADRIQQLFDSPPDEFTDEHRAVFNEFKRKLNSGEVRAAEKVDGHWKVNAWVKRGILLGFRMGRIENFSINNQFRFYDKDTYPLRRFVATESLKYWSEGQGMRQEIASPLGRSLIMRSSSFIKRDQAETSVTRIEFR